MRKILKTSFLGGLTLLVMAVPLSFANACTCPEPSEELATEYYNDMDFVFEGEIVSLSKDTLRHTPKVTLKITRQYKGHFTEREVSFDYNPDQNLCGFRFAEQQLVTLGAYEVEGRLPRIAFSCAQMGVRKYLIMQGGYPR